jgi:hypothetical protein
MPTALRIGDLELCLLGGDLNRRIKPIGGSSE